jgi:diguanylate cyclase (GGDEF)-like protein
VIVLSVTFARSILSTGDARGRAESAEHTLTELRDTLRSKHIDYWRARSTGASPEIQAATRAEYIRSAGELQALVERRRGVTAEAPAIRDTLAAAQQLGKLVMSDTSGIRPGSPRDRALVARGDRIINRVETAISRWVGLIETDVQQRGRADDRLAARLVIILGSLVGLLVAVGIALWIAIDRAHRGAVGEIAAERDATAAVMASVQDGLPVVNRDGVVVQTNDRLRALLARDPGEMEGRPPPWAHEIPPGFVGETDLDLVGDDGRERPVILTSSALGAGHLAGGYVHILKDVTARKRAEAELRDLAAEQDVLRGIATAVAAGVEPTEVFDLVARELAVMLGAEVGVVTRFDHVAERAVDVGVWVAPESDAERPPARVPLDGGAPVARVYRTGRPARVDDLSAIDEKTAGLLVGHGFRAGVAAPVAVGTDRWGAVAALTNRIGGLPDGAEDRLARFAELVGLTVANADARARLASQAATDPLTGLANHRSFHERLEQEVARARAEHGELALVVFDLDRFKDVNDALGHQAGDDVLAEAARRLAGEARFGELVARIGGEEFAWILPGSDGINAWRAAERARRAVAARPFPAGVGTLTASAGVADLTQADDAATLLRLADGALYWAKANGRNVTLRYSPEVVLVLSAAERAERLARSQGVTALRALARAVDAKDPSTARHAERVAAIAVRLASELGWPSERLMLLEEVALLHDVGKIGVPDALLFKPDRLTPGELAEIEVHATLGAEIVSDVLTTEQVAWVRGHHERWDGAGYPDRLAGTEIPEGACILAVADAWDAMTSIRVYGTPRSPDEALDEVRDCSGGQFAPAVAAALGALWDAGRVALTDVGGVSAQDA